MTAAKKAQGLLFDIVHDIAVEGLGPGDRLPSQAEMMRRYRAGPTPLREALRVLEFSGLVSLKPGPNAGAVLEPATAEHLAGLVAPFLSLSGVTYGEVLEAWAATEGLLAATAAQNPDRAQVKGEIAPFAAEPQSEDPVSAAHAIDFHDAVARAAGNAALSLVLQVLSYVVADLYWASTDLLPPGGPVRHDHHEIAEAILAGDAEGARRSMEAHARGTSDAILARVGHGRGEPFRWSRRRAGIPTYRERPGPYAGASANGSAK
jgi:DNA-binding FadR family transcriptional regulator